MTGCFMFALYCLLDKTMSDRVECLEPADFIVFIPIFKCLE